MKITFKNLGTIKQTTLDLRPLTVIIGPNNTNKTRKLFANSPACGRTKRIKRRNSDVSQPFVAT